MVNCLVQAGSWTTRYGGALRDTDATVFRPLAKLVMRRRWGLLTGGGQTRRAHTAFLYVVP